MWKTIRHGIAAGLLGIAALGIAACGKDDDDKREETIAVETLAEEVQGTYRTATTTYLLLDNKLLKIGTEESETPCPVYVKGADEIGVGYFTASHLGSVGDNLTFEIEPQMVGNVGIAGYEGVELKGQTYCGAYTRSRQTLTLYYKMSAKDFVAASGLLDEEDLAELDETSEKMMGILMKIAQKYGWDTAEMAETMPAVVMGMVLTKQ